MAIPKRNVPIPLKMAMLPRSTENDVAGGQVGLPVPWFAAQRDREIKGSMVLINDFRLARTDAAIEAHIRDICWICGKVLEMRAKNAFVCGPMSLISRITSEPRSHITCAEYAVKACPFLTSPRVKRHVKDMPAESTAPRGTHSEANPGVALIVHVDKAPELCRDKTFEMRGIIKVDWWQYGKPIDELEAVEPFLAAAERCYHSAPWSPGFAKEYASKVAYAVVQGFPSEKAQDLCIEGLQPIFGSIIQRAKEAAL